MARILLTSSQVGVVLSAVIIFLATFALFMAGYVLQQNTVAHLREAIKPRAPPIHDFSQHQFQDQNSEAAPSPREEAYPELMSIELVTALESDPGLTTEQFKEREQALSEDGDELRTETPEKPEFRYREGRLGASDDEASFSERRKADQLKGEQAIIQSVSQPTLEDDTEDVEEENTSAEKDTNESPPQAPQPPSNPSKIIPLLGSVYEEVTRLLQLNSPTSGRATQQLQDLAAQYATDPEKLSVAQRRLLFSEQLAQGKSPDVVPNKWEYRRRSWMERSA